MDKIHKHFMKLALDEAAKGVGRTSPNPPVGAVIVKRGKVIATGCHRKAGGPHAEVVALRKAKKAARGATLYITLEPCAHTGKTPPCDEAIVKAGIKNVVIGMRDPNPQVNGRGIRRLRREEISVSVGVLKEECERFYRPYKVFVTQNRPFVTLKAALSLDGMVATASGESQWITGAEAREHGHRLRDQVDAILVGRGTVQKDNPRLTARLPGKKRGRDPIRVVLDSRLRIAPSARILRVRSDTPTIIVTTRDAPRMRGRTLVEEGAQIIRCRSDRQGRVELRNMLEMLANRGVMHLLVEGGAETYSSFLGLGLVDRVSFYLAMKLMGGKAIPFLTDLRLSALKKAIELKDPGIERIGKDLWLEADL